MPPKILLVGATGYVGGTILDRLINSGCLRGAPIALLIRGDDRVTKLENKYGHLINCIAFDHWNQVDILAEVASRHDIVVNAASGFHSPSAEALIRGLARRSERASSPWMIHTSGCSNISDRPLTGVARPDAEYCDDDGETVYDFEKSLEASDGPYPQRTTELLAIDTGLETGVHVMSIQAPCIFGTGQGLFQTAGLIIPIMMAYTLSRGHGFALGSHTGVIDYVHVVDLADLYILCINHILENGGEDVPSGKKGIVFPTAGRITMYDVAKGCVETAFRKGALPADSNQPQTPEVIMLSFVVLFVAGLTATYVFLSTLAYVVRDSREPKTITGTIPFVSPLIGMLIEKASFYNRMRDKHNLPIYTLKVPGLSLYVANSLSVCQRIDRHIATVAFSPIQIRACDKAMGVSKEGMNMIADNRRLAADGYFRSFPKVSAMAASPGPGLDALNRAAVNTFAASIDLLAVKGRIKLDLYRWICHEIFAATPEATYGSHNPFRDSKNEEAWFNYESNIMTLMMDFFPKIFARKGLKARDRMVDVLNRYLEENHETQGSLFIQVGQVAAGIVNTAPTAFWLIWRVLSDPIILHDCHNEVQKLVQVGADGVRTIDLSRVPTSCPILLSTWQETLRLYGISISARVIEEDTLVDNAFLLKKGGVLLMPIATIHSDKTLWGPTVGEFNHKRFLKTKTDEATRFPTAAFRGFGSGHVLCPGRHFASTEVLTLLALILLRFDVLPVDGKWITPKKDFPLDRACPIPLSHTQVELVSKEEHKWRVLFSDNSKGINIVAEDLRKRDA
ncbi:Cytochrome P450 monooxygenase nodJ [Paramyrothecium foliicola]|nr:Cytochrome P450 monooxygenase nodJ [Paramyrothecium foliicola]